MRTAGEACSQANGNVCDGAGQCVACNGPLDCPGEDTVCKTRTCQNHQCGVILAPVGPTPEQVAGDCFERRCDAAGSVVKFLAAADLEDDGLECTVDTCAIGGPVHDSKPVGTPCSQGGGNLCNGAVCAQYIPIVCQTEDGQIYNDCDGVHHPWSIVCELSDDGMIVVTTSCGPPPDNALYCPSGKTCLLQVDGQVKTGHVL